MPAVKSKWLRTWKEVPDRLLLWLMWTLTLIVLLAPLGWAWRRGRALCRL